MRLATGPPAAYVASMDRTEAPPSPRALSRPEFVAMLAMLMATVAFSLDAMLPAMPEIVATLSPEAPNRAQLVIASFVLGMGFGTLIVGPMSDTFGRKKVMAGFALLYCFAAFLAYLAPSLDLLLAARALMGVGASAARVTTFAIIRDLYSGRAMAQMISFVIIVFTLVPGIAPLLGAGVIWLADWRAIFLVFIAFALSSLAWLLIRQPETLPPERRRSIAVGPVLRGYWEVLSHPVVRITILVQILAFGILFATLSSIQPIFEQTFGRGQSFPLWFAGIAVLGMGGGALNARLVMRLGMRTVVVRTLIVQTLWSGLVLALVASETMPETVAFAVTYLWLGGVFATAGLTLGNINALALDPMGHLAGTAAALVAALGNIGAAILAAPVGLLFDGTAVPVLTGVLIFALGALWLMRFVPAEGAPAPAPA